MDLSLSHDELCQLFASVGFITASETMDSVLRLARKAAQVSDVTVLIEGETGTGKQVLANAIHSLDKKRCASPFVTVHCGTITEALAESELFGHQKGAFSGALNLRKGLFQAAGRGTVFLDDINDLPLNLQTKLLDVIQRNVVRAVGSDQEMPIQARIIAASNQTLAPLVKQNRFRSDLYHRLNVVKLSLPPLRERPEDIPGLVLQFVERHRYIYPGVTNIDGELNQFLKAQLFPGNIRELEHAVQRALLAKTEGASLTLSDWIAQDPDRELATKRHRFYEAADVLWNAIFHQDVTYHQAMHQLERCLLETALRHGGQTRREIASRLKTSERTLYHRLRCHSLSHGRVAE
ncbi:MAG TPA: sigma 54-interacting transcriptional regulator [Bryobacteraceae bacterium]|jgi:transcriptional regulator with PAS, ATPase and Fis domain|nr:sigma 54-interacting transcriptional regulator [Bryobacteraceae bacterium]